MTRTKLIDPRRRVLVAVAVAVAAAAGLLATTACSRLADTVPTTSGNPSHSPVAMRLDKPKKLLGSWNESVDRRLRKPAIKDTDGFRKLLKGEPTSAVGTAYTPVEEQYSRELGVHRPGDNRVILVNGVSGTVTAPNATLSHVFAARPAITDVVPVPPGPLGGVAGCGSSQSKDGLTKFCTWVDDHTIGMVTFIGFPQSHDQHDLFRQIRAEFEHRAP
ncbi:hypothetical protein GA0070610_3388 [Micromonospora echinofusca]|uniref:Uncharacterized protein n=1 Tax=Micromonospora echinofusca TaxID=47858 RepID=A0A1C5GB08_MICEH|nr:hypothetical protein [Micromonospora echinofusca]SCG17084.1 hypothetical protein GA0070610_3388 [Micromonospora echinofusca]